MLQLFQFIAFRLAWDTTGQPKVANFQVTFFIDENVRRFYVSVHNIGLVDLVKDTEEIVKYDDHVLLC